MRSFIIVLWVLLLSARLVAAQQGIRGTVSALEANQMPGPGQKRAEAKPVQRTILVYALTNQQQVRMENGIFSEIKTKLIGQVRSKRNGRFRISLGPGRYSIFVKEPDGLYANLWDGDMNIHPVTVTANTWLEVNIEITRNAAF